MTTSATTRRKRRSRTASWQENGRAGEKADRYGLRCSGISGGSTGLPLSPPGAVALHPLGSCGIPHGGGVGRGSIRRHHRHRPPPLVAEEHPPTAQDALPGKIPQASEHAVLYEADPIDAAELAAMAGGAEFVEHGVLGVPHEKRTGLMKLNAPGWGIQSPKREVLSPNDNRRGL